MSRTTRATLLFLGVFIAVVVYFSMTIAQQECEVCMTFMNQSVCRTAASGGRRASKAPSAAPAARWPPG
jgi:hypothetical protein